MAKAKSGDTVKVHYTGTLDDGTQFDSSQGRDPLQFTVGSGQVIPGFDKAVADLEPGQSNTVKIPADEAYGQQKPEMIFDIEKTNFPPEAEIKVGMQFQMTTQEGHPMVVTVLEIMEDKVKMDANHPLAGKDLTFKIELVEIV